MVNGSCKECYARSLRLNPRQHRSGFYEKQFMAWQDNFIREYYDYLKPLNFCAIPEISKGFYF